MAIQSLKKQVAIKVQRSRRNVFLRNDFVRLGGYDQVGRALKSLAVDGKLIKIGYGLYAKARPNRITGMPMLATAGGFNEASQEALKRLGIKWQPSEAFAAYQVGSTQIPTNAGVIVSQRFNRKIGINRLQLQVAAN